MKVHEQKPENSTLRNIFIGKGAKSGCPFHRFNYHVVEEVKDLWDKGKQIFQKREPLISSLEASQKRDDKNNSDVDKISASALAIQTQNFQSPSNQANENILVNPLLPPNADYFAMKIKIDDLKQKSGCGPVLFISDGIKLNDGSSYQSTPSIKESDQLLIRSTVCSCGRWPTNAIDQKFDPESTASWLNSGSIMRQGASGNQKIKTLATSPVQNPSRSAIEEPRYAIQKTSKTASDNADRALINGFTYEEILASPWLRRLYGHLIGYSDVEVAAAVPYSTETNSGQTKSKGKMNGKRAWPEQIKQKRASLGRKNEIEKIISTKKSIRLFFQKLKEFEKKTYNDSKRGKPGGLEKATLKEITKIREKLRELRTFFGNSVSKLNQKSDKPAEARAKELEQTLTKLEKLLVCRQKELKQRNYAKGAEESKELKQIRDLEDLIKLIRLLKIRKVISGLLLNSKDKPTKNLLMVLLSAFR